MPVLSWKDGYSVGVRSIDDEHKQLLAMINRAYDSVENMEEEKVMMELVEEMRRYAMVHFATEEKMMLQYDYPFSKEHKLEHNDFMIKAASSNNILDTSPKGIEPVKIFKYLADWLREHIMKTDKKLGEFLNEKGVK